MSNKNTSGHSYKINLELEKSPQSQATLNELRTAFKESGNNITELNKSFNKLQTNGIDASKQYIKVLNDEINSYDKILKQLDAEKVKIISNKDLSDEQIKNSLKDIETKKKTIKSQQTELKLRTQIQKVSNKTISENSNLLRIGNKMITIQEKLNTLLGKESKLRKGISNIQTTASKIGKTALKVGGGVSAIGGAIVGSVVNSAETQVNKEHALQSLKGNVDPSVVDEVYIKTGADYTSIVNAINKLTDITKNKDELIQGASLEILNPGIGKLLLSASNKHGASIQQLNSALQQVKKQTGLQDVSSALESATKSKTVSSGRISQVEYIQAYAQLKSAGLVDDKIEYIIRDISNKDSKSFIDAWNNTDISKYVYDKQLKNQILNSDLSLKNINPDQQFNISSAQSIAERMRSFQIKKDEMLVRLLPVVEKIMDKLVPILDSPALDKIIDGFINLFSKVIPLLQPLIEALMPLIDSLLPVVEWITDKFVKGAENVLDAVSNGLTKVSSGITDLINTFKDDHLDAYSNGGLATHPSLCGESGPELVLPLNNQNRCNQLLNQYYNTNNFNINGNQNALSLSQQISNNKFIRNASMF